MAEEVQNPQTDEAVAASQAEQEDVFSLEDIDKLIEEDSPEFLESLGEIKDSEEMKNADIESLNVDDDNIDENDEEVEKPKGKIALLKEKYKKNLSAKLEKIFKPFKKLTAPLKKYNKKIKEEFYRRKLALRNNLVLFWREAIVYFKTEFPERLKYYRKITKDMFTDCKNTVFEIRYWPLKKKLMFVTVIPVAFGTIFLTYQTVYSGWLPQIYTPMLRGMNQVADKEYQYDRKNQLIELFKAFPQPDFSVEMKKIVVNLQRSKNSTDTPMATFQVFLKLNSQDTGIEVKDREKELIDIMARAAEEFSYDELNSQIGKEQLKSSLKHEVNEVLNQGRVESIYFKLIIIKP